MIKTYTKLITFKTFEERFDYLKLKQNVGEQTFGYERHLNQFLYNSREWRRLRELIIIRDDGCDLGIQDRKIFSKLLIHHINPITIEDIERRADCVFDFDNLITTKLITHNAIHYGDKKLLENLPQIRQKGDTCLWTVY